MKKFLLSSLLISSIALNLGFVGVYGYNLLIRNDPVVQQNCPFSSEYTHLYATLGLSQEQLEKIKPLAGEFHQKAIAIGVRTVEQRNKLIEEMAKEHVDRSAIEAIHRDIADRQSQMQQLVVSHLLDMKDAMTPEQRSKFFLAMQRSFKNQRFMNQ